MVKNIKIYWMSLLYWNHHEKCTQLSTNMPSIGLVIPNIGIGILNVLRKQKFFSMAKY